MNSDTTVNMLGTLASWGFAYLATKGFSADSTSIQGFVSTVAALVSFVITHLHHKSTAQPTTTPTKTP